VPRSLIALFLALVLRISLSAVARRAPVRLCRYLCFGVALMFSGQAFVNMGVSAGLLPTKGLTLPLVSYGGSSLLCSCALLAIVLRVEAELRDVARPPARRARGDA
jgi:cell division protein FtsW